MTKPPFIHTDLRRALRPGAVVIRTSQLLPQATLTVTRTTSKGWYHEQEVRVHGRMYTVHGYPAWGPATATTVHGDRPWRWTVDYQHGTVDYKMRGDPRRLFPPVLAPDDEPL